MREDYEIDKITAAVIQIEAAFQLMIESTYDEAAYTLIEAANNIIRDVSIARGHNFYSDVEANFVKGFAGVGRNFYRASRAPANFLKHADKDSDDTIKNIDFIELNENSIIIACLGLQGLLERLSDRTSIAYATCAYAQSQNANGYDVVGHARVTGQDEQLAREQMKLPRGELYRRAKISWDEAEPTVSTSIYS